MGLKEYQRKISDEMVKHWLDTGQWTEYRIHDYLYQAASLFPDFEAIVDYTFRLTYCQLANAVSRCAQFIMDRHKPKDVIGLQTRNEAAFIIYHYAIAAAGCVTLSLSTSLSRKETQILLQRSDADAVILRGDQLQDWQRSDTGLGIPVYTYGSESHTGSSGHLDELWRPFLADKNLLSLIFPSGSAADDYIILPTSGTTGIPKLVVRSHGSWIAMGRKKLDIFTRKPLSKKDVVLCLAPIGLAFGYLNQLIVPSLVPGIKRVLLPKFSAREALELGEKENATVMVGVPTQALRILDVYHQSILPTQLRVFLSGGDNFPVEKIKIFEEKMNVKVLTSYGASDVGAAACPCEDDPDEKRLFSSGKPLKWTDVAIYGNNHQILPKGKEGEIALRGPDLISGYYGEDFKESNLTPEGYYLTGDIGFFDEDGYLHVVGRTKDLIIRGGYNISPVEIEKYLMGHPLIKEAVVIGIPDVQLGERVCACLCLINEIDSEQAVTLFHIQSFLESKGLSRTKWPEFILFFEEFPLSSGGKINRYQLREVAIERLNANL